jgi:hypothetical protein
MYSHQNVFDDVRTKLMGDAFDAICVKLHGIDYPAAVREAIADCIIDTMNTAPECDSIRLADVVLKRLGIVPWPEASAEDRQSNSPTDQSHQRRYQASR